MINEFLRLLSYMRDRCLCSFHLGALEGFFARLGIVCHLDSSGNEIASKAPFFVSLHHIMIAHKVFKSKSRKCRSPLLKNRNRYDELQSAFLNRAVLSLTTGVVRYCQPSSTDKAHATRLSVHNVVQHSSSRPSIPIGTMDDRRVS